MRLSAKDDKIRWLLTHLALWEDLHLSSARKWDDPHNVPILDRVGTEMIAAGLYSPKTYGVDIRGSIFKRAQEAVDEVMRRRINA